MTHYDRLVDSIVDEIYYVWSEVSSWNEDDQKTAKEAAQRILEHVEEFQATRSKINQWRASD